MSRGPSERLHKYIASCGYCSRRRAELLIERGLVQVNGKVVKETGSSVIPGKDTVTIHGEEISRPETMTVILNKPAGYITSTHDTHDRLTVMDLLPRPVTQAGVLPAGRLDLDTEGLLVLTNDGDLLHRITHPSFGCRKEYRVHLSRPPGRNDKRRLVEGMFLSQLGRWTQPAQIENLRNRVDGTATLHIVIREGMKRQVRRMFETLGIRVLHLERLAIGELKLGELPRGEWRELSAEDLTLLTAKSKAPAPRTFRGPPSDVRGGPARRKRSGAPQTGGRSKRAKVAGKKAGKPTGKTAGKKVTRGAGRAKPESGPGRPHRAKKTQSRRRPKA